MLSRPQAVMLNVVEALRHEDTTSDKYNPTDHTAAKRGDPSLDMDEAGMPRRMHRATLLERTWAGRETAMLMGSCVNLVPPPKKNMYD